MSFPLSKPSASPKTSTLHKLPITRFPSSPSSNCSFPRQISCRGMSSTAQNATPTIQTVTIPFSDLQDQSADLSEKIEQGFGPNGLGILSISNVPGFSSLRSNLLHLSPRLAHLPEEVKKTLEDPQSRNTCSRRPFIWLEIRSVNCRRRARLWRKSNLICIVTNDFVDLIRYNFGWSHGKEKLESGKLDTLKGSFYANPIFDTPTTDASLIQRYPSYCQPNIWPGDALPELEPAFKALGKLMLDVGLMLAYHCDRYASKRIKIGENEGLQQILRRSRCHKGRLLYYFPTQKSDCSQDSGSISSWCGWHTDHGSLTGLTCGMFMRDGAEIHCPDNTAGLYIKTRSGQIVKAVFEENEIAYQIGETTEILSRGRLCATPHCVKAPKGEKAFGAERLTFALFMQPDWDECLKFPEEVHLHQELISPNGTLTFGEYSEKLLDKYYHLK